MSQKIKTYLAYSTQLNNLKEFMIYNKPLKLIFVVNVKQKCLDESRQYKRNFKFHTLKILKCILTAQQNFIFDFKFRISYPYSRIVDIAHLSSLK